MSINDELRKMSEIDRFRAKPDPGRNLSGKFFTSGSSPFNVDSKYVLFKKPDNREKKTDSGIRVIKIGKNHVRMVYNYMAKEF